MQLSQSPLHVRCFHLYIDTVVPVGQAAFGATTNPGLHFTCVIADATQMWHLLQLQHLSPWNNRYVFPVSNLQVGATTDQPAAVVQVWQSPLHVLDAQL
jgi:hypothetical protein